jgi:hypothetical protein
MPSLAILPDDIMMFIVLTNTLCLHHIFAKYFQCTCTSFQVFQQSSSIESCKILLADQVRDARNAAVIFCLDP